MNDLFHDGHLWYVAIVFNLVIGCRLIMRIGKTDISIGRAFLVGVAAVLVLISAPSVIYAILLAFHLARGPQFDHAFLIRESLETVFLILYIICELRGMRGSWFIFGIAVLVSVM